MVPGAARPKAGAEKSGTALSRARRQCPPPRSPQLPRGRHQGQSHLLRILSRLPADRTNRAQRRHRSRDVDDDVEQELRLCLFTRSFQYAGPLPPRHLRARQPRGDLACRDIFLENGVHIETGPHKHAIQQTFFLYVYEPGGNRVEVANAGARLILAPDWKPIVWTEEERKKGQAWGLKTIESFHTHGTPPVGS